MTDELERLAQLLQPAHSILVVVGESTTFDQLAAAMSLAQTAQQVGKEVQVCCSTAVSKLDINPDYLGLVPQHATIKNTLGKQNLIISFDYVESSVDKVSYAISQDNQKFFLTIKPQAGAKPLNVDSVAFDYAGTTADLIFLIGVHDLSDLKQLYFGYEDMFANTPIVTMFGSKPEFSSINFNVAEVSSYCELMAMLLGGLQLEISADSATALYAGMAVTTKSFSAASVQANTFEIAAELLRRGARRTKELQSLQSIQSATVERKKDSKPSRQK